jgi:hypothetical protein
MPHKRANGGHWKRTIGIHVLLQIVECTESLLA